MSEQGPKRCDRDLNSGGRSQMISVGLRERALKSILIIPLNHSGIAPTPTDAADTITRQTPSRSRGLLPAASEVEDTSIHSSVTVLLRRAPPLFPINQPMAENQLRRPGPGRHTPHPRPLCDPWNAFQQPDPLSSGSILLQFETRAGVPRRVAARQRHATGTGTAA